MAYVDFITRNKSGPILYASEIVLTSPIERRLLIRLRRGDPQLVRRSEGSTCARGQSRAIRHLSGREASSHGPLGERLVLRPMPSVALQMRNIPAKINATVTFFQLGCHLTSLAGRDLVVASAVDTSQRKCLSESSSCKRCVRGNHEGDRREPSRE